jgi:hypothetical protein
VPVRYDGLNAISETLHHSNDLPATRQTALQRIQTLRGSEVAIRARKRLKWPETPFPESDWTDRGQLRNKLRELPPFVCFYTIEPRPVG